MPQAASFVFVWEYGKPPEVIIELVYNDKGGEAGEKLSDYARIASRTTRSTIRSKS